MTYSHLADDRTAGPSDLSGSVDDRAAQLAALPAHDLSAEWLRRQLDGALAAWAHDRTALDIDREARSDF